MNLPSDTSEESGAVAENILRELPADKCRHLAEMIGEHASSLATTMRKSSGWIPETGNARSAAVADARVVMRRRDRATPVDGTGPRRRLTPARTRRFRPKGPSRPTRDATKLPCSRVSRSAT